MPTLTPTMLRAALAQELYEPETPRWERNQERLACRLTADKIVHTWLPFMPYPSTRRQIQQIAARIKADTFRPEDIADIVAPVRI